MIVGVSTAYASNLANVVERTYNSFTTYSTEIATDGITRVSSSKLETVDHSYDKYTLKGRSIYNSQYGTSQTYITQTIFIPTGGGKIVNETRSTYSQYDGGNATITSNVSGTASTITGEFTSITRSGVTVEGETVIDDGTTVYGTPGVTTETSNSTHNLHYNYPYTVTATTNVNRDDTNTFAQATTRQVVSANSDGTYTDTEAYTHTTTSSSVSNISDTTVWTVASYTATSDNITNVMADVVNVTVLIADHTEHFYYANPLSFPIGSPVDGSQAFTLISDKTTFASGISGGYVDAYRTNLGTGAVGSFLTYTKQANNAITGANSITISVSDYSTTNGSVQSTRGLDSGLDLETYSHSYSSTLTSLVTWESVENLYNTSEETVSYSSFTYSIVGPSVTANAYEASSVAFYLDSTMSANSFESGSTFTHTNTSSSTQNVMSHTGFNTIVTFATSGIDTASLGITTGNSFTLNGLTGGNSISYYADTSMYSSLPAGVKKIGGKGAAKKTYESDQAVIPSADMSYSNGWGLSITSPAAYTDFISFSMSEVFDNVFYPNVYTLEKETNTYTTTVDTDTVTVTETLTVATVSQSIDSVSVTTYTSNTSTTSTGSGTFTYDVSLPWGKTFVDNAMVDVTGADFVVNGFTDGDPVTVTLAGFANVTTFDSMGNNLAVTTYNTTRTVLSLDAGEGMVIEDGGASTYFVMSSYAHADRPVYPEEKVIVWMTR